MGRQTLQLLLESKGGKVRRVGRSKKIKLEEERRMNQIERMRKKGTCKCNEFKLKLVARVSRRLATICPAVSIPSICPSGQILV